MQLSPPEVYLVLVLSGTMNKTDRKIRQLNLFIIVISIGLVLAVSILLIVSF